MVCSLGGHIFVFFWAFSSFFFWSSTGTGIWGLDGKRWWEAEVYIKEASMVWAGFASCAMNKEVPATMRPWKCFAKIKASRSKFFILGSDSSSGEGEGAVVGWMYSSETWQSMSIWKTELNDRRAAAAYKPKVDKK